MVDCCQISVISTRTLINTRRQNSGLILYAEQMTRVRDESIEAGTPMRQEDISIVVLGKKKGYLRGFGVGPKPSSCDTGFSTASQARDEQLKRLTSELEIMRAEQQSNREEQQKKEEEQQTKEAENARQREEMQRQLFGLQSMLAQTNKRLMRIS
ncbi:hypothetical protein CsSME_00031845 [Camellia sinensis var. sinensis]